MHEQGKRNRSSAKKQQKKNVTVLKQAPDVHFSDFNSTKYTYNFLKVWFTLTETNSQHKF